MADFNQANAQVVDRDWLDDLLIKEPTGRLHYFKQHSASDELPVVFPKSSEAGESLQDFDMPTPPSIYVSPADDSFAWQAAVGKPQDKSSFVFHPDDESHLAQIRSNLPEDDSKKYSLDKIVARLIDKQQLTLDPSNRELFTNVLFDFFRNRKNSQTTREYLAGKLLVAGKPVSASTLDTILSVIKSLKANIDAIGGLIVKGEVLPPKVQAPAKVFEPTPELKADITIIPQAEVKVETKPAPPPAPPSPTTVVPPQGPTLSVKIEAALPKVTRPPADTAAKPKISDVKNKPSFAAVKQAGSAKILVGPVQELEDMTLANFRRLGASATDRVQKIHSKIAILEKDSLTKKAAGIAAWRKSQVYKLYLDLGAASMVKNKEIANLIQEQSNSGQETLSWEEFNAISDLNKLLRF